MSACGATVVFRNRPQGGFEAELALLRASRPEPSAAIPAAAHVKAM
jgi:hypothetical protein